jgi:F-type H+-transporting ATPase subunit epsilon
MNLQVLIPFRIFAHCTGVSRMVAETGGGSLGVLPNRLDFVAALVPGILTYTTPADGTVYVAVDAGVLVKSGVDVRVSVRRAIASTDLRELHESVKREFLVIDAQALEIRAAVARMEGALAGRLAELRHGR